MIKASFRMIKQKSPNRALGTGFFVSDPGLNRRNEKVMGEEIWAIIDEQQQLFINDVIHFSIRHIMIKGMKTRIKIAFAVAVAGLTVLGFYGIRNQPPGCTYIEAPDKGLKAPEYMTCAERYYENIGEDADVDWEELIPVFHHWRDIPSFDYYFDAPSNATIEGWKALCVERNPQDSVSRRSVQGNFANMNQYMTVNDFIGLWYRDESRLHDDELTTWRLMQYDSLSLNAVPDSEFDKFYGIKNAIQGLLMYEPQSQWDMNFCSNLEESFGEYYDRLLVREAMRHSDMSLADALKKEQEAWLTYHSTLDAAFRIIDGNPLGMTGSAWPMAICGILRDNADMRSLSLEDFYFAMTDSLDYHIAHKRSYIGEYEIERHDPVDDGRVLEEYRRFMDFCKEERFFTPGESYSVEELRGVLEDEMRAWQGWMYSRRAVSSRLTGLCKDCYDNSTNNVRRHKLIMLKNRYQGYGVVSQSMLDALLTYGCPDSEVESYDFAEKFWADSADHIHFQTLVSHETYFRGKQFFRLAMTGLKRPL